MKQQVLIIHGGDVYRTHREYIKSLRKAKIDLARIRAKGWKANLAVELGKKFDVLNPRMPNSLNARYKEWKIWFEKFVPLLDDGVILVGHSLGGIFLAKYLSENAFPKKIKATFLIAATYDSPEPLLDFHLKKPLKKFSEQAGTIYLYHSKDDKVVPVSNFRKYAKELPQAKQRLFFNKGHFNQEKFRELVKDIRKV